MGSRAVLRLVTCSYFDLNSLNKIENSVPLATFQVLNNFMWLVAALLDRTFPSLQKVPLDGAVLQHPFPRMLLGLCPDNGHFWNFPVCYSVRFKFLHGISKPSVSGPQCDLSTDISHCFLVCNLSKVRPFAPLPHRHAVTVCA